MLALRYILAVVIRSVFMVLGIPGNGLIIVVYCKKQRKTGTDIFILGLAIVDFIVCLSFPVKIYSYVTSQFTNDILCKLMHFIIYWNTYLGVFLTAAITVDRYIAVCKPLKRRVSPKQAVIIISICTILAVFPAIPSVTMTGIQSYGPAVSKCSYNTDTLAYAQILAHFNDTLFYSCMALIIVLYILIWVAVRRQARVRVLKLGGGVNSVSGNVANTHASVMPSEALAGEELLKTNGPAASPSARASSSNVAKSVGQSPNGVVGVPGNPSARKGGDGEANLLSVVPKFNQGTSHGNLLAPPNRVGPSPSSSSSSQATAKAPTVRTNTKTTTMIFIITVIFFISWIPTRVWNYYPNDKFTWLQTDPVRYNIFYVSLFAVNLNQVINPFIYSFVNVQFRRECVTVMRHIRRCSF